MPLTDYSVIYGGSFNPPHIGHQIACLWLMETLNAKEVLMVPTYKHAFGKKLESFEHRMKMCDEICRLWGSDEYPYPEYPGNVWACDVEKDLPHPNITLNTVEHLDDNRKLAVAIGSDLVDQLDEWVGWDDVIKKAKVVVIGRSGSIRVQHDYPIYEYPVDLSAISSSQVRDRIRRGKDITGLVPKSVKEYIEKNGLYK